MNLKDLKYLFARLEMADTVKNWDFNDRFTNNYLK